MLQLSPHTPTKAKRRVVRGRGGRVCAVLKNNTKKEKDIDISRWPDKKETQENRKTKENEKDLSIFWADSVTLLSLLSISQQIATLVHSTRQPPTLYVL
jgi:hypothetical protein